MYAKHPDEKEQWMAAVRKVRQTHATCTAPRHANLTHTPVLPIKQTVNRMSLPSRLDHVLAMVSALLLEQPRAIAVRRTQQLVLRVAAAASASAATSPVNQAATDLKALLAVTGEVVAPSPRDPHNQHSHTPQWSRLCSFKRRQASRCRHSWHHQRASCCHHHPGLACRAG